jgi:O-antigen/teichoic acid export membrane protein
MSKPPARFWKNVVTVLAGAMGAQAVPLMVAPLVTRLCSPAELGAFSVWLGVIALTSIIGTLRFDAVMVVDRESEQQRLCFSVVAYSATLLATTLTLLMAASRSFGLPGLRTLSWFELLTIGLGTWLTAYMQATLAYAASHNLFGKAAKAKVMQATTIALSQLALLYAGLSGAALLTGQLIGLCAGLWTARRLLSPPQAPLRLALDAEQRGFLSKHQAFWRFSVPSSLLNTLVSQLPLFMIGLTHGALAAGLFALTQRVLSVPSALVATSILEVFKRQATQEFHAFGTCRGVYRATFKALLLLALGPSLVIVLFSPQLFSWVFGPDWRAAGTLARILAPMYFFAFIASPLSYVFFIAGKQRIELLWQVALAAMTVAAFAAPASLHEQVLLYAVGRSVLYMVYLYMSHACSERR